MNLGEWGGCVPAPLEPARKAGAIIQVLMERMDPLSAAFVLGLALMALAAEVAGIEGTLDKTAWVTKGLVEARVAPRDASPKGWL